MKLLQISIWKKINSLVKLPTKGIVMYCQFGIFMAYGEAAKKVLFF